MKKKITKKKAVKKPIKSAKEILVNFVLDETGSMSVCLDATISGFNEYVTGLKARSEKILFTLTQWDSNRFNVVYNSEPIKNVKKLTYETYRPGQSTPLYDAIAKTIRAVEAKGEKKGRSVLCVIMTDGEENASREWTLDKLRNLIKQKEKDHWTFVYLGANQDAWKVGQTFGMSRGNTMSYDTDVTGGAMANLSVNTVAYCSNVSRGIKSTNNFFVDNSTYEKAQKDKK